MPIYAEMGRRPLMVDASLSFRMVIVSRDCGSSAPETNDYCPL